MDLKEVVSRIENIDFKIINLLVNRMELDLIRNRLVGDDYTDKTRIKDLRDNNKNILDKDFVERIFLEIKKESKREKERHINLIAFQGEHGAFSEMAANYWNSRYSAIPCPSFENVVEGVQNGLYEIGILPVENSLGGAVAGVNKLLIDTSLKVVGAVKLSIHHCLLAPKGVRFNEIRTVYSHPQALSQCRLFLSNNNINIKQHYDTAGAARSIAEGVYEESGAIASRLAGNMYNLEILKSNIEDLKDNKTRFLILSPNENIQNGSKCSILFSISSAQRAGTLFKILELFAKNELNLTRIESVPAPNVPGQYVFFLDFEGSVTNEKVLEVLKRVENLTNTYKFLGCYNELNID